MPTSTAYHAGIEKPFTVALVYQCGIANVFARAGEGMDAQSWQRVFQGDFRTAETLVRGARLAGAHVSVFHSDVAGDCAAQDWHIGPGDLFSESKAHRL